MAALAEDSDVEATLLRALTSNEQNYVDALLARASRAVRVYTGQYIEQVTDDEVTVIPDPYGNLRLPQWPVTDVASVTVNGDEIDPTSYVWNRQGVIRQHTLNSFEINGTPIAWRTPVVVTYTHGYEEIPDDIIGVVADLVAGRLLSPAGSGAVKAAQVDDVRVEYDVATATASVDLTDDQKTILDRYKLPGGVIDLLSVRL